MMVVWHQACFSKSTQSVASMRQGLVVLFAGWVVNLAAVAERFAHAGLAPIGTAF